MLKRPSEDKRVEVLLPQVESKFYKRSSVHGTKPHGVNNGLSRQ